MQIGQVVQEPFKGWEVKKMTSQDISGIPYSPTDTEMLRNYSEIFKTKFLAMRSWRGPSIGANFELLTKNLRR